MFILIVIILFIITYIENKYSPRIDWFVHHLEEDVQIYQVILWYNSSEGREFKKLFKI